MRVTNGMIINNSLNGLYNNMNNLNKTYAQMVTGKKIQTVSDDPIIAGRSLKLRTTVMETTQHESNAKEAESWMEITEASLQRMQKILEDVSKKCEKASNANHEKDDLEAIEAEIDQLWQHLQEEANTTYEGRYVFSGFKTDKPLMKDGAVNTDIFNLPTMSTDGQDIKYEVGVKSTIAVNTTGMDSIFNEMKALFDGIKDDCEHITDSVELNKKFSDRMDEIEGIVAKISEKSSDLGSRMRRVDYIENRLGDQKLAYKTLLTDTEDINAEEVYTDFSVQYAVYQSALQATSKIITNTLADYL